jgi:anti-sigma-K factor RskA
MHPPSDTRPAALTGSRAVSAYWRAATYFCLLLLALGSAAGLSMYQQFVAQIQDAQQKVQQTAQLQYLSVLQDEQGEAALLLTYFSGEAFFQLQRLNSVAEGSEDSLQLWALPEAGAPRSLGVLTPKLKTLRLAATAQSLEGISKLGMSVEAKGGALETRGPRLPYLFTASVIRKAL